jgi:hypothetical protein
MHTYPLVNCPNPTPQTSHGRGRMHKCPLVEIQNLNLERQWQDAHVPTTRIPEH